MIALLPSPWAQWKGAPLRVMLVTEKLLQGETSLTGLDGSVAASGGLRFPALPPGEGSRPPSPERVGLRVFQRMNSEEGTQVRCGGCRTRMRPRYRRRTNDVARRSLWKWLTAQRAGQIGRLVLE